MNTSNVRHYDHLRNVAYNDLCRGVQTSDEKLVDSAVNRLSVCGSRRDQVGFSIGTLEEHYERVSEKLNRLSTLLASKQKALREYHLKVARDNGAGNHGADIRQSLNHDIQVIGTDVRILSRIEVILADQLRRRGIVLAMREERHSNVTVTVQ